MFQSIIESINRIVSPPAEQLTLLIERLTVRQVPKDGFLIREGQTCSSVYFINHGFFRHFNVSETGEESTIDLYIHHEWMLEYKSFVSQQPSQNCIQATSDSEVLALHARDIHDLTRISERFFRLMMILEMGMRSQEFQQNRLTPEEKYQKLLITRPELVQHFPLKHIASYMGMTPETLSRIRKKISL
ncbi:MAG: Crp/Fnr family transcriptional regulator [Chitinophagaceae bacterium]